MRTPSATPAQDNPDLQIETAILVKFQSAQGSTYVIQQSMGVDDMLSIVANSGHSRFPVVDEGLDEVVGILLAKDLAHYSDEGSRDRFEIKDILGIGNLMTD